MLAIGERGKEKMWLVNYNPSGKCKMCGYWPICKGGSCPRRKIEGANSFELNCQKNRIRINNMIELAILENFIHYNLEADA